MLCCSGSGAEPVQVRAIEGRGGWPAAAGDGALGGDLARSRPPGRCHPRPGDARIAVGLAMRNALAQFGIISAFPLWAILVIVLDIVVIYQLVARWEADLV
jgi:hypothetical protein